MFKKLWEWIKKPHGWPLILLYLLTVGFIAGAIVLSTFEQGSVLSFVAYGFYALAAITLGYTVYTLVLVIPNMKRGTVSLLKKNSFTNKLYEQYGFRTVIFAACSLVISLGNAVINGTIGIINLSSWYGALGAYYFLLSSVRGGVLLHHRKRRGANQTEVQINAAKTYRICGILLVLLPIALSSVILEIVASGKGFVRAGMMIYVSALYTVYKVAMSVKNFFKARKNNEMTVRAIRNVNLVDAMVSILALQTAMFHEFSEGENFGTANVVTGVVVCLLTAVLGIIMIINGTRTVKRIQNTPAEAQEA